MIENDSISVILLFPYRCRFSLSFMAKTAKEAPVMTPVSSTCVFDK